MNRQVRRSAQVRQDLIDIYRYLYRRSPQAAERVFDAIAQSIRSLLNTPGIGRLWNSTDPRLEGMRVVPVKRYRNYLIFFRPIPTGIEVFRVVQGMQELERIIDEIEIDFDEDSA
jgi:toxin ParE1/3/4